MKTHPEELELAQQYTRYLRAKERPFQGLTDEQSKAIIACGRRLYHWFKTHQWLHGAISLGVVSFLLAGDFLVLLGLPRLVLGADQPRSLIAVVLCGLMAGLVRGWILYSMAIYSLHEGAAHHVIVPPTGAVTRPLNRMANNLCRIAGSDPVEYAKSHLSHHGYFGTKDDAEFLNFVMPRRYWLTLIPFAMFINVSDFIAHRPLSYTRSRLLTAVIVLTYNAVYFALVAPRFGLLFALLTIVLISPHVAFQLDRLRQFSEHNLMPLENRDGARSFGPGFWGLLIGGGPWGQPCHWMHHLIPTIPWYQQIILHYRVAAILPPPQRQQYFLAPLVGYPRLLSRLWTEPNRFRQGMRRGEGRTAQQGPAG